METLDTAPLVALVLMALLLMPLFKFFFAVVRRVPAFFSGTAVPQGS